MKKQGAGRDDHSDGIEARELQKLARMPLLAKKLIDAPLMQPARDRSVETSCECNRDDEEHRQDDDSRI